MAGSHPVYTREAILCTHRKPFCVHGRKPSCIHMGSHPVYMQEAIMCTHGKPSCVHGGSHLVTMMEVNVSPHTEKSSKKNLRVMETESQFYLLWVLPTLHLMIYEIISFLIV